MKSWVIIFLLFFSTVSLAVDTTVPPTNTAPTESAPGATESEAEKTLDGTKINKQSKDQKTKTQKSGKSQKKVSPVTGLPAPSPSPQK